MEDVFTKKIQVHFYDCDPFGRMKLSAVNKILADVAGEDYTQRGMSHSWLWDRGYVFLLSKVSILFERHPGPQEFLTLSTWEREIKGASFFRAFALHDEAGEKVLAADSSWMLVNPETRQILRPGEFPYASPTFRLAECPPCRKLKMEGGNLAGHRPVAYSDLDANGHVYNAVYADIAVDFLPLDTLKRNLRSYQVNFAHEARLGDTLDIWVGQQEQVTMVKGQVGDHDSFLCALEYCPE